MYTTQKQIRKAFWESHPEASKKFRVYSEHITYLCDTRCAFVDYIDNLARDGVISESLASRATL